MKASIIYTVAASVVLISTLETRLEKNNFGKVRSRQTIRINSISKSNENQKAIADFTKVQLAKTSFDSKKKGTLVIAKPELVLEETPTVFTLVPTTEKKWSFESAIIEENENEETLTLDDNGINTFLATEEAIEVPVLSNKEISFEAVVRQENAIIEETEKSEIKALDFNWINTLTMYDEVIVLPSKATVNNTLDFSVVGDDSALSELSLDFNWIETLQMFDEPIVTPPHLLTEESFAITDYLNNTIIESNQ